MLLTGTEGSLRVTAPFPGEGCGYARLSRRPIWITVSPLRSAQFLHYTKAKFNNCFIIHSKYFITLDKLASSTDLRQNFGLLFGAVSGYKHRSVRKHGYHCHFHNHKQRCSIVLSDRWYKEVYNPNTLLNRRQRTALKALKMHCNRSKCM